MFVVSFSANEQSKFYALAGKFPFDLFAAFDFLKKARFISSLNAAE